ncbi:ileal sodium/bile acid cotransporter-like [Macrosteles quadrilineatus]|uniref:ileal sodium/bile acid cotransporter-like n=1 Tax=Macrosteles quadrilineatus TaxID=74068 RepID=UPI0023E2CA4F|nr:ileal sodium/bile acid cotransporter-like [Macrosteles quadrilineatus]
MCPLWPLHIILMYLVMLAPLWMVSCQVVKKATWAVDFHPDKLLGLPMYDIAQVSLTTSDLSEEDLASGRVSVFSDHPDIAELLVDQPIVLNTQNITGGTWTTAFNVSANFIGYTEVKMRIDSKSSSRTSDPLKVTVTRKKRIIDTVFMSSVIVLVSIIFINFGCALDWPFLRKSLRRPVGPAIGFFSQFIIMPLLSYMIGLLLFANSVPMRLGLFFTGIAPAGGASNIWTFTLGGNLNLSITMTAVSTIASFVMIPLWAFTLGQEIFSSGAMVVPYNRIASSAIGLVVPLSIGYAVQHFAPSLSKLLVRILKPFSIILILSIIIFATVTNWYLFRLFTWQIMLGGMLLPLLGYLLGAMLAWTLGQSPQDILAIAVETGIQNTGIAIFMLQFCLGQPEADLTTVVPVAVAVMSPVPLLSLYAAQRLVGCIGPKTAKPLLQSPIDDFTVIPHSENVA